MYSLLVHGCIVLPRYVEDHMLNMLSSRNKDISLYIIIIISMGIQRPTRVIDVRMKGSHVVRRVSHVVRMMESPSRAINVHIKPRVFGYP